MTPEKAVEVEEIKGGWWRTAETLLRVTSMGLCVVSLTVMLKNTQSNEYGSLSYSDLSGFQYVVYTNGICAMYSLVSAFYFAVHRPLTLARAWAFFVFDQAHAGGYVSGAHGGGSGGGDSVLSLQRKQRCGLEQGVY